MIARINGDRMEYTDYDNRRGELISAENVLETITEHNETLNTKNVEKHLDILVNNGAEIDYRLAKKIALNNLEVAIDTNIDLFPYFKLDCFKDIAILQIKDMGSKDVELNERVIMNRNASLIEEEDVVFILHVSSTGEDSAVETIYTFNSNDVENIAATFNDTKTFMISKIKSNIEYF